MIFFNSIAGQLPEYGGLARSITSRSDTPPVLLTGLSLIHKAHFLAALALEDGAESFIVLVETENEALRLTEDINTFCNSQVALVYPAKDLNIGGFEVNSREYEHRRLNVLSRVITSRLKIAVATSEAAGQFTTPPKVLAQQTLVINQDDEIALDTLALRLVEMGFSRCDMVEGVSQFSIRGAIVDIYAVNHELPVRIEFWGDTPDSISFFEPETQRREENTLTEIDIAPCFESYETTENATLFDYAPHCIICEQQNCAESYRAACIRHEEDLKQLVVDSGQLPVASRQKRNRNKYMLTNGEYKEISAEKTRAYLDTFMRGHRDLQVATAQSIRAHQLSSWSGEYKLLKTELADYFSKGYAACVFGGTEKAARTLAQDLKDDGLPVDFASDPKKIYAKRAYILAGTVGAGYDYPDAKCVMLSLAKTSSGASGNTAVLGTAIRRKKKRAGEEIRSLTDISAGDYVVHQNYGIGIFEGVTKLTDGGVSKDYIKIKYAGTDVLYVPVTQLDFISRYIGNTDAVSLKLNKINGDAWQKAKVKAKAAAAELAEELIKLYSKRLKSRGHQFPADNSEQVEFEEHFSYIETDDQLRCIEEIKADMQDIKPMDRLLCGDVGFGKTEVALRGAFKCVMDGKQCALLCPTTVLAWQHYQTAIKRMGNFPVNIELLSRFRSPKEIRAVISKLKKGIVDLVIGTHRLVQSDVEFHNLGLAIIDEEQRFGVSHKEKFKEKFSGVDVLTLSATPIPRTLNMAMSGIRDMSVINTPPQDRQPVTTYVIEHDKSVIAQAINKELRRNGQVYYIHNRIETILDCATDLLKLCPDARIATAHGKLNEDELLEVWRKLLDNEIDVLVCTTLIETGVDVPNVNTLIIENADHMGLAQLHQLRGRVGRTNKRAYAYFTFKRGKVLSEISTKRLNAIREFTQFGSGFNIAMRDLEIRGAGSILGAKQSGHLSAVGYDMYLKLLNEAVNEQRNGNSEDTGGNAAIEDFEVLIDVKTDAFIPENYIQSPAQRITCYKRIAEIRSDDDSLDVIDELLDRYGEPPAPVLGLIQAAEVRNMAQASGIATILQEGGILKIRHAKDGSFDMEGISRAVGAMDGRVTLDFSAKSGAMPSISVKLAKGEEPLEAARGFLRSYSLHKFAQPHQRNG
ncbi:MAG: transcription-repair coupling factor [Oscillospiraceae bacterium]|nr:transcription-repair coupling factor [Oscillospiraceae bacterium]